MVTPPFSGGVLAATNLTGNPCVVFPHVFGDEGTPRSMTLIGRLYGEAEILRVAKAFQDRTEHHRRHPSLE